MHRGYAGLLMALALGGSAPDDAMRARALYDFGNADVIIWSEPNPGSDHLGLGQVGEQFESDWSEPQAYYRCDDNFDSTLWYHGRHTTTDVVGWVPACDLTDAD